MRNLILPSEFLKRGPTKHNHILLSPFWKKERRSKIFVFSLWRREPPEHNQTLTSHFGEGGPHAVEEDIKKITSALLIQSAALNLCKMASLGASRHSPQKGKRVTAAFCNLHLPRNERLNLAVRHSAPFFSKGKAYTAVFSNFRLFKKGNRRLEVNHSITVMRETYMSF